MGSQFSSYKNPTIPRPCWVLDSAWQTCPHCKDTLSWGSTLIEKQKYPKAGYLRPEEIPPHAFRIRGRAAWVYQQIADWVEGVSLENTADPDQDVEFYMRETPDGWAPDSVL